MVDKKESLTNFIWDDILNNFTHDTAVLRYGGPIKLFLSGPLCRVEVMKEFMELNNLKPSVDIAVNHYRILTVNKYWCLRISGDKNIKPSVAMMFPNDKIVHPQPLTARQVRGKLVTCSLRGLQAVDKFYKQQFDTLRTEVMVAPQYLPDQKQAVFCHIFKTPTLFAQAEGSTAFHVKKGITVKPEIIETSNQGSVYASV